MLTQVREKYQGVLTVALNLHQQNPDWVTFFREVLGIEGVVRRAFPDAAERAEFETSAEYEEIQKLLTKLRERRGVPEKQSEATRVITVRIPKSMHESLIIEAQHRRTSMNKLCISKLLQVIEQDLIPIERATAGAPRTKPAPQPVASSSPSAFGGTQGSVSSNHYVGSQSTFRSAAGF